MEQSDNNQGLEFSNFKIPKKKVIQDLNSSNAPLLPNSTLCEEERSVLSNSDYNSHSSLHTYPGSIKKDLIDNFGRSITEKIYKTLSEVKEKPKKYETADLMRQTIPDFADKTLPKELTLQFQPLFCKLCSMQLTSNQMAKLHYKSKNHEKKVRKFLVEYAETTGEPVHKRAKLETHKVKSEEESNPRYFYCEVCDLKLTGKMHAESHYMGKNHQKALLGYKAPAGKGSYNAEGKWVRLKQTEKIILKDGEDTFGMDFRKDKKVSSPEVSAVQGTTPSCSTNSFSCSICSIVTSSEQQLEMHFKGQKHQKKLKQLDQSSELQQSDSKTNVLSVSASTVSNKFSPNRTPSVAIASAFAGHKEADFEKMASEWFRLSQLRYIRAAKMNPVLIYLSEFFCLKFLQFNLGFKNI